MTDTDLFIHSAEIAGVFVGFGALIAVRSGATMAVNEFNDIRWVVTVGIWVVIVALAPMFIASYGLGDHGLWFVSGLLALGLFAAILVVFGRTPENRAEARATVAAFRTTADAAKLVVEAAVGFWLPTAALVLVLVLVVLGPFPDQEQALYLSAVGLGLLMAASALFYVVLGPSPSTASDRLRPPASGASSA